MVVDTPPCTTIMYMKALSAKENRDNYDVSLAGSQLDLCYQEFTARFPASTIQIRSEAIQYLMTVVDQFGEDREVVSIAMNYLDRFICKNFCALDRAVASPSGPTASTATTAFTSCTTNPSTTQRKAPAFRPKDHWKYAIEEEFSLATYVVVALDLAIRLHSPFSGDGFRAAVQSVAENQVDQMQTARTVVLEMDASKTETDNVKTIRAVTEADVVGSDLSCDVKSFTEQVKREFHSGNIYISEKFTSLRMLSGGNISTQEFARAQAILMGMLEFYLHPVRPVHFIRLMFQSIECDLMAINERFSSLSVDFQTLILSYACYQAELSTFIPELVNAKPSIIAFAAVQNAMEQLLPNGAVFLRKKISLICEKQCICDVDSKETMRIRHFLLRLWKKSHPSSLAQVENVSNHGIQDYCSDHTAHEKEGVNCFIDDDAAVVSYDSSSDDNPGLDLVLDQEKVVNRRKKPKIGLGDNYKVQISPCRV